MEFVPWRGCNICSSFHGVSTAFIRTRKPIFEGHTAEQKVEQMVEVPWRHSRWPSPYSWCKLGLMNEMPKLRCLIHLAAGSGCIGVTWNQRGLSYGQVWAFRPIRMARLPDKWHLSDANRLWRRGEAELRVCCCHSRGRGIYGNPWKGIALLSCETA